MYFGEFLLSKYLLPSKRGFTSVLGGGEKEGVGEGREEVKFRGYSSSL